MEYAKFRIKFLPKSTIADLNQLSTYGFCWSYIYFHVAHLCRFLLASSLRFFNEKYHNRGYYFRSFSYIFNWRRTKYNRTISSEKCIKLYITTTFHPAWNDLAERFVRSFKTFVRKNIGDEMPVKYTLHNLLSTYRFMQNSEK